ncbi:MAG: hypothetical protein WC790_04070, partial [Candidatus Paceibacterota bacterium]
PQFSVEENGAVLRPDDTFGFVITPGSDTHDAWGFKNRLVPTTTDIVAIGDSHTYGTYGADTDWSAFLEKSSGRDIYNLSVWGYGPVEYLGLLPRALSLHPHTVVIAVYLGNDVFNAYDAAYHRAAWTALRDPSFVDAVPVDSSTFKETHIAFRGLRDFLREHLAVYRLLGDGSRLLRERLGMASPRTVGTRDWATTDLDASLIYDETPSVATKFWPASRIKGVDLSTPEVAEGLAVTKRVFIAMKEMADKQGVPILFAFIPEKEEVYAPLVAQTGLSNAVFDASVQHETHIRAELAEFCSARHLYCTDMLPGLQASVASGDAVYRFHWDEHPAPDGYAVYASLIQDALSRFSL